MFNKKKRIPQNNQEPSDEKLYDSEMSEVSEVIPAPALRDQDISQPSSLEENTTIPIEPEISTEPEISNDPEISDNEEGNEEDSEDNSPASPESPTLEALEKAYCLGAGIDEESFVKAKHHLYEIAEAVNSKAFKPEMIDLALKLLNLDSLIEDARREGLEQGKKENIAEAFRNKRKKAEEAASLPHLHGSKGLGSPTKGSIFDIARDVY